MGLASLLLQGRVSADIVKMVPELVKPYSDSTSYPKEIYMIQYKALACLHHLFVGGNVVEQSTLISQFLTHGIFDILMQVRISFC